MTRLGALSRPVLVLAALAATSALAAVVSPVSAAVPAAASADAVEPGAPLPWHYQAVMDEGAPLTGASGGYLMHDRTQYQEGHGPTYTVVRVSDGAVVDTFEPAQLADGLGPTLVDDSVVQVTWRYGASDGPVSLDVHDLGTGADTTIDLDGHDGYLHGDDAWALVSDRDAVTGQVTLSFVFPDRTVPVTGLDGSGLTWVGGDSGTAYVATDGRSFALDPQTGVATPVTLPDGSPLHLWAVTDDTLVGDVQGLVDGVDGDHFTVLRRNTGELLARMTVGYDYHVRSFVPYGDRVAAVTMPDGGYEAVDGRTVYHYDLRPVDPATGAMQDPVASDLAQARPAGNGRVALAFNDVPTGRLAVLSGDGVVQPVGDLPRIGELSLSLGLSDGTAVSGFEGRPGLWTTPDDGTGDWQPTYPDSRPEDTRRGPFSVGGDVVLTQLPDTSRYGDPSHFRLAWPGGHRDVDASGSTGAVLGHDGRYLLRWLPGNPSAGQPVGEVQDVRTGGVVTTWSDHDQRFLDGNWLWRGPTTDGTMTATDLTGQEPDQTSVLPATCNGTVAEVDAVRGRWVLARCTGFTVLDLYGVLKPWDIPDDAYSAGLGDGYVAWVVRTPAATCCLEDITLKVADFSLDHATHAYGPLRGQVYPPGPGFATDTADRPDLVYVDPSYRVRHVHLDWLGVTPATRPDETAPSLTVAPALGDVRSAAAVSTSATWAYVDPEVPHEPASGLDTYDVRWQPDPAGATASWTQPDAWTGLGSASVTVTLPPGSGRCFEARARDRVGNTSAWSAPVCRYVDGAAPVLAATGGSPTYPRTVLVPVTFRFGARDDDAVASYDVQERAAARGKPLGPWQTRWPATRTTSVSVPTRPGSEHCFRFRARDRVGNVSGWSPARCNALPVDDSEMTTRGSATRGTLDTAVVGSVTELDRKGASATLAGQAGRRVGLYVVAGPYQGKVDVYGGDRFLGRVSLTAPWQRGQVLQVGDGRPWTGPVRVVAVSGRPARIDAIAVLR